MRISEIFYSIQGEGSYAGQPMAFIRFQGCPFQCLWCDSKYTWDFAGGEERSLESVISQLRNWPTKKVCVTGGEPLAHPRDLKELTWTLSNLGYWIEVETAGGYHIPFELPIDSWVMDIKCPDSGMEEFNKYQELAKLRREDQLKFVVSGRRDFDFALRVIRENQPRSEILFSPVWGEIDVIQLNEWIKTDAPNARLSIQIHKLMWGPEQRGV